jgi:hypothetical protein
VKVRPAVHHNAKQSSVPAEESFVPSNSLAGSEVDGAPPVDGRAPNGRKRKRISPLERVRQYDAGNLESAGIILEDPEKYGGEGSLPVSWARAVIERLSREQEIRTSLPSPAGPDFEGVSSLGDAGEFTQRNPGGKAVNPGGPGAKPPVFFTCDQQLTVSGSEEEIRP